MSEIIQAPRFLVKFYERPNLKAPAQVRHSVFYDEDTLMKSVKNIRGNFTVFEIGKEYESLAYFQKLFEQEKIEEDRIIYERLKSKFEPDDKTE